MASPVATQHTVDQLLDLVFQDELTGLNNRRYLNNRIGRGLEDADDDRPYAFLLLDIDFFKAINDSHGHAIGDRTLEAFAGLLRGACGDDDEIIRFAGDEFVCYLPGASAAQALARAEELVARSRTICIPVKGGLDEIRLTISVGVACHPEDGAHWDEVLERADEALYQAKRSGRDRAATVPPDGATLVRGDDLSRIFPCPDYIGQDEAFDWLGRHYEIWRAAAAGAHAPLFVCRGEHGHGKSRFLNEFAALADRTGLPVLRIAGSPERDGVCYGALIAALIDRCGSLASLRALTADQLDGADQALWERFLDTSRDEAPPISAAASDRLFGRVLRQLADTEGDRDGGGIVLLVDDAELVDESTLALLASLHRADDPTQRLFVVAACGSGEEFLADLAPPTVALRPLDADGTRAMVAAILPTLQADDAFNEGLYRVSGGNCMYIEEALKYLIQVGRLVYERSTWRLHEPHLDDLPSSLRELVARRLACLDPEIQATLAKAAVVGADIRPELLNAVEAADAGQTLDLLEKARKLGLLEGGRLWEERDFHFQYGAVKDAVYDQIPAEDRIVWHRQMAALHETLRDAPGLLHLGSLQYHLMHSDQRTQALAVQERLDGFVSGRKNGGESGAGTAARSEALPPTPKAKWPKPSPLSNDELTLALRLIHSLRASLQTARLYPPESRIVRAAYEELHTNFGRLFVFTPALDLAEADGELLINGEQPIRREDERTLIDTLRRSLLKAGLSGIAFARGITLPQIEALLNTWLAVNNLEQEPADAWESFRARSDIAHIDVNARIYVALDDGLTPVLGGGEAAGEPAVPGPASSDTVDIVALFQDWARQQSSASAHELSRDDLARLDEMLCRLREMFFGEHPAGAAPVADAEQTWLDLDGFDDAATDSDLPSPAEVTQSGSVAQCIADIVSGAPKREARGYQQLALLGSEAVEPLYRLLSRDDDGRVGQVAGEYLKALAFDLERRVAADLQHHSDPAVKLRLVNIAVPLIDDPAARQRILLAAAALTDRAAATEAVVRLAADASEPTAALLSVMPACSPEVQVEICSALERLGDPICVEPLLASAAAWRNADSPQQMAVVAQACQTLGRFGKPEVLALLAKLVARPSRWPWRKSPPRPVRKAALIGLEKIGTETAGAVIAGLTDDPDAWIRLRARRLIRPLNPSS